MNGIIKSNGTKLTIGQPTTLSLFIQDISTSMRPYGDVPRQAINDHFDLLRADKTVQHLGGVITFCSQAEVVMPIQNVLTMPPLRHFKVQPGTRLYQTVDETLLNLLAFYDSLSPKEKDNLKFVIGVVSDGWDLLSDSAKYPINLQIITQVIHALGWELLSFGIGIDGQKMAKQMGFPTDPAHAFTLNQRPESFADASIVMTQTTHGGWQQAKEISNSSNP